jgi:subfamily B ATP-binding cassette protein HlyB/CyaB
LVSLPLYFGAQSLAVVPHAARALDVKFARGAENQAMLVETHHRHPDRQGHALEPPLPSAGTATGSLRGASFKTQNLATVAHEGVNLIGKLVNAATLWYGAHR